MVEIIIKICTKCKVEKDLECFGKNKIRKDGLKSQCKECDKKYEENNVENYVPNKLNLTYKKCGTCKIEKDINNFSVAKRRKDGFAHNCKDCKSKSSKKYEDNNKDNYVPNKLNLIVKKCGTCKIEKDINDFSISKRSKDGFNKRCNDCKFKSGKKYHENNKDNYVQNRFNLTHKVCGKCKLEQSIENFCIMKCNRDGFIDRCNSCRNEHNKNRRKNDPVYKLRQNTSRLVHDGLKSRGSSKAGGSFYEAIGYTAQQLMDHLMSHPEKEPWMNENNQGVYRVELWDKNNPLTWVWHIDHINPHSTFNYTSMNDPEFKKCWSLSNLRPLSAKKNLEEGNRR